MPTPSTRYTNRFFVAIVLVNVVLGIIGYSRLSLQPADGLNTYLGFWRFFDDLYMSLHLPWLGGGDVKVSRRRSSRAGSVRSSRSA